jgi:glycosyltransferase involved in cell wall biosynthesis
VTAVDIIVRTKNRPQFLARALDDILAQEFTDWHLIIVDNSDDPAETQALVDARGFGDRCTVLSQPDPVGVPALSNLGIKAGAAEFITIHDDDDTWHPQFLTRTTQHLRSTDDLAVAVRTEIVWETTDLQETGREVFHPAMQEPTYFDLLRFNHMVPIGIVFRRSAYDDLGPFDERCEVVDDWVFNLSLARAGGYGFLGDEPLAFWHQRPDATGDAGNTVIDKRHLHIRDDRRVRDRALREYVDEHGPGGLLYLAKYIDERTGDLHGRLDRIEAQQGEILRLLHELTQTADTLGRIKRRVARLRP